MFGILGLIVFPWHVCIFQSREGSSIADDWDERPHTIEEVKAMLEHRKEAALKREKNLSQALSQQVYPFALNPYLNYLLCFVLLIPFFCK